MSSDDDGARFEWVDGPDAVDAPRPATKAEWDAIDDVCIARGWMSISRRFSRVLVAYRGDTMIGFHVFQMVPHAEPQYVNVDERGTGLAERMADQMAAFLEGAKARGWMVVADSPFAEKMCKARGMVRIKSPVYTTVSRVSRVTQ
jgi:hypothetical protein